MSAGECDHSESVFDDSYGGAHIAKKSGNHILVNDGSMPPKEIKSNFCPECGTPLRGEWREEVPEEPGFYIWRLKPGAPWAVYELFQFPGDPGKVVLIPGDGTQPWAGDFGGQWFSLPIRGPGE